MPRPGDILRRLRDARDRHCARHRPTGFEFALADRIDFVNGAHWDALTGAGGTGSVFQSRAYLAALDATAPANVSPRYAIAYRGGEPVVAMAMQIVDARGADVERTAAPADCVAGAATRAVGRVLRKAVRARVLVCGNLLAWGRHGVAIAPGIDAADAWHAVAEGLYRVRRAARLTGQTDLVVVKDVGDADAAADLLRTYSYRPLETEPDMVLDLPSGATSFDGYLAALKSKYRKAARTVIEDTADAGYEVATLADLAPHASRLHDLYRAVQAAAPVRLFTLSPGYLPRVAAALGDRFRCVALLRGGEVAGYVTVVADGATAVGYYMGFERAVNGRNGTHGAPAAKGCAAAASASAARTPSDADGPRGAPLYLRLLYAAVEAAISMGCRRLSLGRTALEPKSRLGARPVPLRCWVRHRTPVLNLALRGVLCEVPHDTAPEHAPFK